MRTIQRIFSLLALFALPCSIFSQNSDRFAFAVTDQKKEGIGWNVLRKLDLQTGEYTQPILLGFSADQVAYDATSRKQVTNQTHPSFGNVQAAFATGVAAMAYDMKNNRLYYTPMFVDQLRYIDLRTMKLYYVTDQSFTGRGSHSDEGRIITRMVIAPDGYGYALSNDGETFVRFSTGKKIQIEQLGNVIDAPNNGISIKSRCTSWGGDMIADDEGALYVLSSRNVIYKIDIESRIATLQQPIKGLSPNFTINGAVVNDENKILVSSAVDPSSWFVVDPASWTATAFSPSQGVYKSSDLANSNYLSKKKKNVTPQTVSARTADFVNEKVQVYPNPVLQNQFSVQFVNLPKGDYQVELTDILGRIVVNKLINLSFEGQVETFRLPAQNSRGVYLIKIKDQADQIISSQKLIVQ